MKRMDKVNEIVIEFDNDVVNCINALERVILYSNSMITIKHINIIKHITELNKKIRIRIVDQFTSDYINNMTDISQYILMDYKDLLKTIKVDDVRHIAITKFLNDITTAYVYHLQK